MSGLTKLLNYSNDLLGVLEMASHRLVDSSDLDVLLDEIGDSRFVLLGEASHGTHEYYAWRTHISKRLISEKNFTMIALEGDWPDCYRVNRYVKSYPNSGSSAVDVLQAFNRWPTWMWANWEMVAFVEWLHKYNRQVSDAHKVGFYGLDIYSLWESMESVMKYLEKMDPAVLKTAIKAMNCFEPYNVREGFSYADRTYGFSNSCEREVTDLLVNIRKKMAYYNTDHEAVFSAEQNALVASNAERYYQVMLSGGSSSWNIRDQHMTDTLNRLVDFYGKNTKVIVWEHNTHIGDARATDMKSSGLINVGQLMKEQHDSEGVFRVGFGSYEGSVSAAYHWGGKQERMFMPKAKSGRWEFILHESGAFDKMVISKDIKNFKTPIGHRAIGVVYDPDFEFSNYVPSIIPARYEAFIYLNKTHPVHSLHVKPDQLQMPETYPWGV